MSAPKNYFHIDMGKGIIGIKKKILANEGRCLGCGHSTNEYCQLLTPDQKLLT